MLVKVGVAGLGVPHKNIQLGGGTPIGKRLVVQKRRDGRDVVIAQIEFGHPFVRKTRVDDGGNEFSMLIVQDHLRANQIGPRLAAAGVGAMAKAAVSLKQLLSVRNLRRRSRRALRIGGGPMSMRVLDSRFGRRGSFRGRLLGKSDDSND